MKKNAFLGLILAGLGAGAVNGLFGAGGGEDAPTTELGDEDLADGKIDILTLLVKCELCASKSEARRNVQQGGVTVESDKVTDFTKTYTKDELTAGLLVKRGKKNYRRAVMK